MLKKACTPFIQVLFILVLSICFSSTALAGDAATILFKEGHVAYIANGYEQLASEYKKLSGSNEKHKVIELKLESSPFLINIAEIVIICRDKCSSLTVKDPRQTENKK